MSAHTNHQIIRNQQGTPQYVVVPYAEYLALIKKSKIDLEQGVPSEVVNLVFNKNYSPAKAWREYLGLTQEEAAANINVSQSAYSQFEAAERPQKKTRAKIAAALGINLEQLDF